MVEEIWQMNPLTLREVVLDRPAMVARLADAAPMERVWILATLDWVAEASDEGEAFLRGADSRFGPLLLLGYVRLRPLGQRRQAVGGNAPACLHTGEGGRRAVSDRRRLFEEGRYLEAVREFGWACDLRRTHGWSETLVTKSISARERAYTLFRRRRNEGTGR